MKNFFAIIAFIAISTVSLSQTQFYPATKTIKSGDSTKVIIDSTMQGGFYLGVLGGNQFRTDTNDASVSVRIGITGNWQLSKKLAVESYGMYHLAGINSCHAGGFNLKFSPIKNFRIQGGYMATLATEQRPNPVTGDGHFETVAEAQSPGDTYNVKVVADSIGKFSLGGCVAYRDGLEYQAMVGYNNMKLSSWYTSDGKLGGALTLNFYRVYNVTTWRDDNVIANFLCIKFGKDRDYQIFSDNGYDLNKENLNKEKLFRSESGFLKTFKSISIFNVFAVSGLWGISYRYEKRSINAYLFYHL